MRKYTPVFILFGLILMCFGLLLFGFFQQDEWLAFGYHYLVEQQGLESFFKNAFIPRLGHYSPFNYILEFFLFLLFRVDYINWALLSILFHFFNSFLVYKIAKLILKKENLALACGSLFAVSASAFHATAWPVANIGTHCASFFGLLAFYFWISKNKKYWIWAIISLGVSLLFKEITIAMFLLLPLWSKLKRKYPLFYLGILFVLFVLIRAFAVFLPTDSLRSTIYDQPVSSKSEQSIGKFTYNFLTFPIKGVSQSIVSSKVLISFSKSLANLIPSNISGQPSTTQRDNFVLKYLVEILNVLIFLTILLATLKSGKYAKYFLIFVMLNSIVFSLSPEREGKITILDSRNLYYLAFGSSILLILILQRFAKKRILQLLIFIISINFVLTFSEILKITSDSKVRRDILIQVKKENPDLPAKVIFYIQSDSSYYGLPETEKILPFQSGLGQTLLVWYYQAEQFPPQFLQQKFLWEIGAQDYLEINGRGFGYFRNYEKLNTVLEKYNLSKDLVIGYNWDSKSQTLSRIDF